jgi:sensor histidine kinase YesM
MAYILGDIFYLLNEYSNNIEGFIQVFPNDHFSINSLYSLVISIIQVEVSIYYLKIINLISKKIRKLFLQTLSNTLLLLIMNLITSIGVTFLFKFIFDAEEVSHYHFTSIIFSQVIIISFTTSIYQNLINAELQIKNEKEKDEIKIRELKNIEIANNAQLTSLKLQIEPHFMFNNFSILAELIETNSTLASQFLEKLSDVYRYIIQNSQKDFIDLHEELSFLESYLFLIQIRYDNKVMININEKASKHKGIIPPVVLQLLVENAIKHNIASKKEPLRIDIDLIDDSLVVKNNFNPRKDNYNKTNIGQNNLLRRYQLLNIDKKPAIIKTKDFYKVVLPIIEPSIHKQV